ncbi:B12-binding domain-containing radical SAM protein [candidate division KSB3 bacterium]|uniref:B12-binding domain-containing radical SAM protein n=1 Tax=candidate division KSB3 bacterium TaxID=2044937 RepID=A0A2G6E9N0_9BACT|nr:MAG: B12-binding domain-containing radical SAM protein [candidate division KSB3 bacterium]PIE30850.1 MAG: B12-binding domain-containing radical SAM protein [candidate division KSB3 bacterium]
MNIVLISPDLQSSHFKFTPREVKSFWFAKLTLPHLAALTPDDIEVKLTDEAVEPIDFDAAVDLVGITVNTYLAPRAYEIAAEFRRRGVPVVLGGVHPSLYPDEARRHADAIAIGEAETIWEPILRDAERGKLQPVYRATEFCDLKDLPLPRRDLLKQDAYLTTNTIQTTRGCPFDCDFCSVTDFFGHTYRCRPLPEVLHEIETLDLNRPLVFVDDNIIGRPQYALELFNAMKSYKVRWGSQCSINLAKHPTLMKAAKDSGCVAMFIGIESISQENLRDVHKGVNQVDKYYDAIQRIHDHGISINAGMILGMDHDDEGIFERTLEFLEKTKIEYATFHILTPVPGTILYRRMEEAGRIIDRDWSKYNGGHTVFKPKHMSPEALEEGYYWTYHQFYSMRSILKRIAAPKLEMFYKLALNLAYKRMIHRFPKGELPEIAKLLHSMNGEVHAIPSVNTKGLIPRTIEATQITVRSMGHRVDRFLKIRVHQHHCWEALMVELTGVLNGISARRLRERIAYALQKTRWDIIVNFEHVQFVTLYGLKSFLPPYDNRTQTTIKCLHVPSHFRKYLEDFHQGLQFIDAEEEGSEALH